MTTEANLYESWDALSASLDDEIEELQEEVGRLRGVRNQVAVTALAIGILVGVIIGWVATRHDAPETRRVELCQVAPDAVSRFGDFFCSWSEYRGDRKTDEGTEFVWR